MMTDNRQLNDISFLKGIAILGIVFVHSAVNIDDINIYYRQITRVGQFGCQLFFLISGYLMMCSWNRLGSEMSLGTKIYSFYKKRIISILPVYVTVVLFYQLLSYAIDNLTDVQFLEIKHDKFSILLNIILLHGFDVNNFNNIVPGGWFIGTIFIFYLAYPLLRCLYDKIERKNPSCLVYIPLLSVCFSFVVQFILFVINDSWEASRRGGFIYYSILNQLPCMLLGMNIGVVSIDSRKRLMNRYSKLLYVVLWGILSLILFFVFRKEYYVFIFLPYTLSLSFYYLYYLIIDLSLSTSLTSSSLYRVLNKWGDLSFAVYFSNVIGGMLMPWFIILLLNRWGCYYNPTVFYFIILPFIFFFSYIIAIPINNYIKLCSSIISKLL